MYVNVTSITPILNGYVGKLRGYEELQADHVANGFQYVSIRKLQHEEGDILTVNDSTCDAHEALLGSSASI